VHGAKVGPSGRLAVAGPLVKRKRLPDWRPAVHLRHIKIITLATMLKPVAVLLFSLATGGSAHAQTKAVINHKTKSFSLIANIRRDHQIFGYAAPDVHAKKLILFSVFTNDVKNNPYQCPLGSYYETSDLPTGDDIRFVATSGNFVKLNYLATSHQVTPFYIKKSLVLFE
jgi:hypothetical protein